MTINTICISIGVYFIHILQMEFYITSWILQDVNTSYTVVFNRNIASNFIVDYMRSLYSEDYHIVKFATIFLL